MCNDIKFENRSYDSVNQEMLSTYMKKRGMANLKLEDLNLWTRSFGENYYPVIVTLKDSDQIIITCHGIEYESVHDENKKFTFIGFLWIDEDFRGKEIMVHIHNTLASYEALTYTVHTLLKPAAVKFFKIMTGEFNEYLKSYVSIYDKNELHLEEKPVSQITLKKISEVSPNLLTAYDQSIFPFNRADYITEFLKQKNCYSRIALNSSGEIIGYGNIILFESTNLAQIQPLYADNAEIASAIVSEILHSENLDFEQISHRSNDKHNESYEWFKPLLKKNVELRREFVSTYGWSGNGPKDFGISKVFSSSSTIVCPI
ncbi:unnamed protein product [Caenorhabditis angaria]|uniref:DUF1248 domain-containing protein n=1 Tax=Caenorhabditis angaria TaxID=860376 RepID=A0A9P1IA28_9PELO|nr:unnamed protein product [Caenorhabditis angaria]